MQMWLDRVFLTSHFLVVASQYLKDSLEHIAQHTKNPFRRRHGSSCT